MNFQKVDNVWKAVTNYYEKVDGVWSQITETAFNEIVTSNITVFGGKFENSHNTLTIGGYSVAIGETCSFTAICDNVTNVTESATWTVISGSNYGTISSNGTLTISSTANESTVVIQATYDGLIATKEVSVTYESGSSTETNTEIVVDPETGDTTTTTTTIINYSDGTSSSESTTTTYDSDGNPSYTENTSTDVSGNVNTQEIEYDEDGDPIVTGYSIDTSNNPDGVKNYNGDGVNTEYYAFDLTHGFVLNINFTINYSRQPSGQNENHHNILTMKRATPSPWYGFQLRHSNNNKVIILGTQFATGNNTNTNITGRSTGVTNEQEFNLTITYNPNASSNKFVCRDNINNKNIYTSNLTFPDIEELRYLKVTIGHALDADGNPYRYSNINVINFSINRT